MNPSTNSPSDLEILLINTNKLLKSSWQFLLTKWIVICIFGFGGSGLGLLYSLMSKPQYKAHLSFALIEKGSGASGLAALASSFGFGGLNSSDDAFSGDNLLEILKSRNAVEKTLLTPVDFYGKTMTLADSYIQINELKAKWINSKNIELHTLSYPIGMKREAFSRAQDSVLTVFYKGIVKSEALVIQKKDKKSGIVYVDYSSSDELFSKLFVENLMKETYKFFKDTRTALSRANIKMMEEKADSIRRLYESALYTGASITQFNVNEAIQTAAVPRIKQQNNAQLYATVYAEVLKNLETLKLDLARQTPLVQIIDSPILPLEKKRIGKAMGMIVGGMLGGILILLYLIVKRYLQNVLK